MTGEQVRALLEERARVLARPVERRAVSGTFEAVSFVLADERYAIESRFVVAVFPLADLALLPGAKAPVLGVTAWRGGLLTVLDLRPLLGLSTAALNDLGRVIAMGEARAAFGILVDAVLETRSLRESEVRELPDGVAVRRDYVRGVTGDALVVLDGGRLLRLHG
ncbi:MAG: chemotaxis protein CheW [Gemmatimonadales bacterium]